MLSLKLISEMYGMKVFTESGNFFGTVEEVIMTHSRIHHWQLTSPKKSILSKILGNAKGVTMPHNLVKAIRDVMIVQYNPDTPDEKD